jgi:uncharacterized protein YbjQ (UPF0145 family)
MRTIYLVAVVLLAACDPAASQPPQVPTGSDSAEGSSDSARASGSGNSVGSSDHSLGSGQLSPQTEPARASPEEAAKVQILFTGATPQGATEVLGVVDVHEPGRTDAQGLEIMKERAAAMHADAVIGVEFHRDDKDFTDLSGLAVRYNDLLRNRQYDVLEVIKVHEGEGKDGDAMRELQRRAGALHADLIIGVSWHDNDAEKDGTYLSGTAIKYRPRESQ